MSACVCQAEPQAECVCVCVHYLCSAKLAAQRVCGCVHNFGAFCCLWSEHHVCVWIFLSLILQFSLSVFSSFIINPKYCCISQKSPIPLLKRWPTSCFSLRFGFALLCCRSPLTSYFTHASAHISANRETHIFFLWLSLVCKETWNIVYNKHSHPLLH